MKHTKGQSMPDGTIQYYKDAMGRAMISTDYDPTSSYAVGDYCIYDNVRYCCNTAIASGGETWNSAHWDVAKVDDDISAINTNLSNFTTYSTSSDRVLIGTKQGKPLYRQYLTYSNVTVATNTDKTLTSVSIPEGADNITVSDKSYIQSGTMRLNACCAHSNVYTNARTLIWRQTWSSSATWSLYLWIEYTMPN